MFILNKSIPLLFGTPSLPNARHALSVTLIVSVLGIANYLLHNTGVPIPYFEFMTVLLGFHGLAALQSSKGNLLFLFRYFLVWVLIFATAFVWALYDGEVKVAPFGVHYQTEEYTSLLVFAGLLSLCGSLAGWHVALFEMGRFNYLSDTFLTNINRRKLLFAGILLSTTFALLYVYKAGGFVGGEVAYAADVRDFGFEFGVFNIFHFIGISSLILAGIRPNGISYVYLWISIGSLTIGVLTGSRADFLPQSIILLILLFSSQIKQLIDNSDYVRMFILGGIGILLAYLGYKGALFIAIWRTGESFDAILSEMAYLTNDGLLNTSYGHLMVTLETGNMVLGGFYAAIVNVKEGLTGLLLGESYLNYLLIAPPAFLGLPRPEQLEWKVELDGVFMAQGGIFEIAEAYWNFGLLGCVLVPFLISYFFGWLLKKGLIFNSYFYLMWYLVFGLMSLRAVWYQNFSYFRIFTIMLLIYIVAQLFVRWFVEKKNVIRYNN